MRTYGRVYSKDPSVPPRWVEVTTDPNGFDDQVWLTTFIQCLLLNLNESPFYANFGIPAKPAVVQQVFPDYYVAFLQRQFAPHFASLIVAKEPGFTPRYRVNVTFQNGTKVTAEIAV